MKMSKIDEISERELDHEHISGMGHLAERRD